MIAATPNASTAQAMQFPVVDPVMRTTISLEPLPSPKTSGKNVGFKEPQEIPKTINETDDENVKSSMASQDSKIESKLSKIGTLRDPSKQQFRKAYQFKEQSALLDEIMKTGAK